MDMDPDNKDTGAQDAGAGAQDTGASAQDNVPGQEKARAKAGPMKAALGRWSADGKTFSVIAEAKSASDADVKAAVVELGFGEYDLLIYRTRTVAFTEKRTGKVTL